MASLVPLAIAAWRSHVPPPACRRPRAGPPRRRTPPHAAQRGCAAGRPWPGYHRPGPHPQGAHHGLAHVLLPVRAGALFSLFLFAGVPLRVVAPPPPPPLRFATLSAPPPAPPPCSVRPCGPSLLPLRPTCLQHASPHCRSTSATPLPAAPACLNCSADQGRHRVHHQGRLRQDPRDRQPPGALLLQNCACAFCHRRCAPSRHLPQHAPPSPHALQRPPPHGAPTPAVCLLPVLQDLLTYSVKGLACWADFADKQGVEVPMVRSCMEGPVAPA